MARTPPGSAPPNPLLVFGDDWGRHPSTIQHVINHRGTHDDVIWVNSINLRHPNLSLADLRRVAGKFYRMISKRARTSPSRGAAQAAVLKDIVTPRVAPWHKSAAVRRLNRHLLVNQLNAVISRQLKDARPVIVASNPMAAYAVPFLRNAAVIYYCLDEYAELDGVDPAIVIPAEREMLEVADLTIVTAATMVAEKMPRSQQSIHIPQGVNTGLFSPEGPTDEEISGCARPIVGFAGTLESRVCLDLLGGLAERLTEGSIVLVGARRMDLGALADAPNVHVFPRRSYEDLPAVLRAFDVGLVPYKLNRWTRAVDPLKVLEYLATGLPVVSTPLPEVLKHEPHVTVAAATPDRFTEGVHAALRSSAGRKMPGLRAYAEEHSWTERAARFDECISVAIRTRRCSG